MGAEVGKVEGDEVVGDEVVGGKVVGGKVVGGKAVVVGGAVVGGEVVGAEVVGGGVGENIPSHTSSATVPTKKLNSLMCSSVFLRDGATRKLVTLVTSRVWQSVLKSGVSLRPRSIIPSRSALAGTGRRGKYMSSTK